LSSAEFADLARIHPEAFTRQRALSLPHRVSMRLKLRKGSIGDEFDRFFEVLHLAPGGANLSEHLVQTPLPPALGQREKCRLEEEG